MSALEIIIGIVLLLLSIAIIFAVILQEGHRSGISGAISGGADTFLSKSKAKDANEKLAKGTKYIAIAFFVIVLLANIIALVK